MAIQSKTAAQLKSEVLKPSSRPYELIEYDPDKIFTGEINPDLINSNITTYEKNSEGTIIIDKNKDLTSQKMLISLNTTKISNVKFNQIIDIEFQDFPDPVDKSTAPLNLQINALQVKGATEAAKKAALEAKIDQLNSQIESLRNVADLAKIIVNEVPDSIAYGTALYSDESGIGSMLLSQHRRARGVINENGTFKVTLGNYDGKGKLIDGEETVTFDTYKPPGGPINNINAYALTDLEANQYLINNPDIEVYMNSRQPKAIAASQASLAANKRFAEAEDVYTTAAAVAYSNFIAVQNYSANVVTVTAQQDAIIAAEIEKNVISDAVALASRDALVLQLQSAQAVINGRLATLYLTKLKHEDDIAYTKEIIRQAILSSNASRSVRETREIDARIATYQSGLTLLTNKLNETKALITAEELLITAIDSDITAANTVYSDLVASNASTIQGLEDNKAAVLNKLANVAGKDALIAAKLASDAAAANAKTALDAAEVKKDAARNNPDIRLPINLYGWDAGGSLVNAAKAHWRYINTSSKSELLTRFYLSDDEARAYLNTYPDLQAAFGNNLQLAKRHWNENGFDEGRTYSRGASLIHIWRSDVDEKGYVEIVKTNPWSVRYSSEYVNLSQSSRIGLDDNGILFLYDKDKIVWQSFN